MQRINEMDYTPRGSRLRGGIAVILLVMLGSDASAQCPLIGFDEMKVIFHGTVIDVSKAPKITFDVDRVWKGQASRRFDVTYPSQISRIWVSEGLNRFDVRQSYLVLAREIKAQRGSASGIAAQQNTLLIPDACGTRSMTLDEAIRHVGSKGYSPR
jgi:hypothetical protein